MALVKNSGFEALTTGVGAKLHIVPIPGPFLAPLKLEPARPTDPGNMPILDFCDPTHCIRIRTCIPIKRALGLSPEMSSAGYD